MEPIQTNENRGEIIQFRSADVEDLHLEYRLYESRQTADRRRCYAISAAVLSHGDREEVCVCDVTRTKRRALSLFRLICDGLVTPCTLTDVLEDLL